MEQHLVSLEPLARLMLNSQSCVQLPCIFRGNETNNELAMHRWSAKTTARYLELILPLNPTRFRCLLERYGCLGC